MAAQRIGLVLLLTGSLVLIGGSYRWSTLPLFLSTLAIAALQWRRIAGLTYQIPTLQKALLGLLLAIAVQLVPLPQVVVNLLSPHAQRVRSIVRLDSLTVSSVTPLTIDAQATVHAFFTLLATVLVFLVARYVFAHGGVRSMCRAIAMLGAALAIEGLVQRAASPRLIFGFWQPPDPSAIPFGPFVNRNHYAAWLLLALPLTAGYLVAHARIHLQPETEVITARRVAHSNVPLLTGAIAIMTIALLATLSRSALIGLCVSAVAGWWLVRRRLVGSVRWFVMASAAGILLVALMFVDVDAWAARVTGTLSSRLVDRSTIWLETLPMLRDFWLAGTGAGTYGIAMIVYQQSWMPLPHLGSWAHFNQAHSHYLQLFAEGGLLMTIPAVIALVALIGGVRRRLAEERTEMRWIRVGAAAALVGVAAQSIWETALRMPANAFLCAVVAAIAVYERRD